MNSDAIESVKKHANGMFAKRETIDEAMSYATGIIESLEDRDKIHVYTALYVVINTIAEQGETPWTITTEAFWDCECKEDYIHYVSNKRCSRCLVTSDDQPDSRISEVRDWRGVVHGEEGDNTLTLNGTYNLEEYNVYYGHLDSEFDCLDLGDTLEPPHPEYRWLPIAREVVRNHQYQDVGNLTLDAQTANMLINIYDNLKDVNQLKFKHLTFRAAIDLGWKMTK